MAPGAPEPPQLAVVVASVVALDDARREGKHAITGKKISPMAPVATADRFTDAIKDRKSVV